MSARRIVYGQWTDYGGLVREISTDGIKTSLVLAFNNEIRE